MNSLKITSIKVEDRIRTALTLHGSQIWSWEGYPYVQHDAIVTLDQIVTSLLVSKGERSITVVDVSERDIGASTIPPLYQTVPDGYRDLYALILASQESLGVTDSVSTPESIVAGLLAMEEAHQRNSESINVDEFPDEIMAKVDEPDPLTMQDRDKWIEAQESAYLKDHVNEDASILEVARRRFHKVRKG